MRPSHFNCCMQSSLQVEQQEGVTGSLSNAHTLEQEHPLLVPNKMICLCSKPAPEKPQSEITKEIQAIIRQVLPSRHDTDAMTVSQVDSAGKLLRTSIQCSFQLVYNSRVDC